MKERGVLFGEPKGLLGILTEPAAAPPADRPAVVFLNAGLVHRVGPHRMSVRLARALAEAGYLALRFDLSGVGDSEPRRDALSYAERALLDVKQAVDFLAQSRGVRRVVSVGLCSGADNSYWAALRDPRIAGVVSLDGFAYRTPRFYARYYGPRVLRPASWRTLGKKALGLARKRLDKALGSSGGSASGAPEQAEKVPAYVREFPPKAEYAAGLATLAQRGARLLLLYSAGMHEYYNYEGQLWDAFPAPELRDAVTTRFFAGANHTFTELAFQDRLTEVVTAWVRSTFP